MIEKSQIKCLKNNRIERWANIQSGFFNGRVYLVGSSLTKEDPRDTDIVCIISDYDFCWRYGLYAKHSEDKEEHRKACEEWYENYKTGTYDDTHWYWCKDVVHKAQQGARFIATINIDYKVISETMDKINFNEKLKLRIDKNPLL